MPAVESSMMSFVEYDDAHSTLVVAFLTGRVYAYADVAREVYDALLDAGSKGSYFNAMIRGAYSATELPQSYRRVSASHWA